jgi:hypothetical protein
MLYLMCCFSVVCAELQVLVVTDKCGVIGGCRYEVEIQSEDQSELNKCRQISALMPLEQLPGRIPDRTAISVCLTQTIEEMPVLA